MYRFHASVVLCFLCSFCASSALACGGHGFWVLGKESIYLSHKPMYNNSCHDAQVVMEVKFNTPEQLARYRKFMEVGAVTFQADGQFQLESLKKPDLEISGVFWSGNFERKPPEGLDSFSGKVIVKRILVFERLSPKSDGGFLQAYLIGSASEAYLINRLDRTKDCDQIVQIAAAGSSQLPVPESQGAAVIYNLQGRLFAKDRKPQALEFDDRNGTQYPALTLSDGRKVSFRVLKRLFRTYSGDFI